MKKDSITSFVRVIFLLEICIFLFLWIDRQQKAAADFKAVDTKGAVAINKNNPAGIKDEKIGETKNYKSPEEICSEVKNAKTCSEQCRQLVAEENNIRKEIDASLRSQEIKTVYKKPVTAVGRVAGTAVRAPRKISCPGYGHPSESDTKGKHMDEDCCPDYDEWPKPGCVYDAKGYGIMLSGPAKKK